MFLIIAGIVVIALLSGTYAWDRRARRQGHRLRAPGEMARDFREAKQDAHVIDSTLGKLQSDVSWTAHSRRNRQR
ncbi:MAG TPA: hypothetical protein VFU73_09220 [Actinocrinis sp.]|nr:hypothetical protein [Actinocrinis sp.]